MNQTLELARSRAVSALTKYDMAQQSKRGYNRYALAHYFAALDSAVADVEDGRLPYDALSDVFCDRVFDVVWKAWNA